MRCLSQSSTSWETHATARLLNATGLGKSSALTSRWTCDLDKPVRVHTVLILTMDISRHRA